MCLYQSTESRNFSPASQLSKWSTINKMNAKLLCAWRWIVCVILCWCYADLRKKIWNLSTINMSRPWNFFYDVRKESCNPSRFLKKYLQVYKQVYWVNLLHDMNSLTNAFKKAARKYEFEIPKSGQLVILAPKKLPYFEQIQGKCKRCLEIYTYTRWWRWTLKFDCWITEIYLYQWVNLELRQQVVKGFDCSDEGVYSFKSVRRKSSGTTANLETTSALYTYLEWERHYSTQVKLKMAGIDTHCGKQGPN